MCDLRVKVRTFATAEFLELWACFVGLNSCKSTALTLAAWTENDKLLFDRLSASKLLATSTKTDPANGRKIKPPSDERLLAVFIKGLEKRHEGIPHGDARDHRPGACFGVAT